MRSASIVLVVLMSGLVAFARTHVFEQSSKNPRPDRSAAIQVLDAYERGMASSGVHFPDVGTMVVSLDAAALGWVAAVPPTEQPRRRMVVAMVVLETSMSAPFTYGALLEWGCEFLRRGPKTEFERLWLVASIALQEASYGLNPSHVDHALSRVPDEPRLQLAKILTRPEAVTVSNRPGVSRDALRRSQGNGRASQGYYRPTSRVDETPSDLARLATDSVVGSEARAHLGLLHFLLNRLPESIREAKAAAEASDDPFVQNLAWVVVGLASDAQGKRVESLNAFRSAVAAAPTARVSATALAMREFLSGQRVAAAHELDVAYGTDHPALDPWRQLVADDRFLSTYLTQLRAMVGHADTQTDAPLAAAPGVAVPEPAIGAAPGQVQVPVSMPAESPNVFRLATSAVTVEVAVKAGNLPVTDLRADEFEVLDNGVPQHVELASVDAVPLDVSLIADLADSQVSQNISAQVRFTGNPASQSRTDLNQIARLLRPTDRLRAILAFQEVFEAIHLTPISEWRGTRSSYTPHHVQLAPTSAIYDAVASALLRVTPPDRRHLVLTFTDGIDGTSITTGTALLEAARQSDAVMHVARRYTVAEVSHQNNPRSSATSSYGLLWPADPFLIEEVARATGGTVRHPARLESMVDQFKQILDEYRQSYLLRYQPAGVTSSGWHTLTVRVKRPGKYEVIARRGYFAG